MNASLTSYAWSQYSGQYGIPMLRCYANDIDHVRAMLPGFKSRAAGLRGLLLQNVEGDMVLDAADRLAGKYGTIWWPNGVAKRKKYFQAVVDLLSANRVGLDFVIFDIESTPNSYTLDPASLKAINADPRYAALAASGNFPPDCSNMDRPTSYWFNYGCQVLFNAAVNEAIITPLRSRYPNVAWSNFLDFPITKADAAVVPDMNGHPQYLPPSNAPYYAPAFYGSIGNIAMNRPQFKTPWYCLAISLNVIRAVYRAKPTAKVMPWLAPRVMSNTLDLPHWQELIYHACCLCGPRFLYFNANDFTALSNWRFDNAIATFVGQTAGSAWASTPTTALTDYDAAQAEVSAARLANGRTVGRVTFKPNVTQAVCKVAGRSITVKRPAGQVGAWFKF